MPAEKNYILSALIFVTAAGIPFVVALIVYRRLIRLRERCEEAWRYLAAELTKRHELCAKLMPLIRAEAINVDVVAALDHGRAEVASPSPSMTAKTAAETELAASLGAVFLAVRKLPEESSAKFDEIAEAFASNEERINAALRFYNVGVRNLNDRLVRFPYSIVATWFGLAEEEGFSVEATGIERPLREGVWGGASSRAVEAKST